MATQAYYSWVDDGKPWENCKWLDEIEARLESHGFIVYDYPNVEHQQATYPQDHTAYSYTGWPIDSPYGKAFALDIMPRSGEGRGMPELTRLARQIIADKDAKVPGTEGIKYINWTDEQGRIWQTSWKPDKVTKPNTDKGHIHLSGCSDSHAWSSHGYDPYARMMGSDDLTPEEHNTLGYIDGRVEAVFNMRPATIYGTNPGQKNLLHAYLMKQQEAIEQLQKTLAAIVATGLTPEQIEAIAEQTAAATKESLMTVKYGALPE